MSDLYNTIIDRENTDSVKWDLNEKLFHTDDVLPMWVADMDIATPKCITDALHERIDHPVFGYTFRSEEHLQTVVDWHERRHQWHFTTEQLCFCPGVVPGINMLVMTLTKENDGIIIQPPVYPPFFDAVNNHKRRLLQNPLKYDDGRYTMDLDGLEAKMKEGAKMLIISNPHNPVGRAWTKEELQEMITLCKKYEVLIVSDEIHCDLVLPGYQHVPTATVDLSYQHGIISAVAPSKTFNIAGLATSYLIIPDKEIREKYLKILDAIHVGGGNVMGTLASKVAYEQGEEWLHGLLQHIQSNFDYAKERLLPYQDKVKMVEPEATYLLWLDCSGLGLVGSRLHHFMIHQARLGLNKGLDFGKEGKAFARMNLACPKATLEEGLNRLIAALEDLSA